MLLTTMIFEPHGIQIHRWAEVQDMGVPTLPQVRKASFRPERQMQTNQSPLILWNTYNYSKNCTSRPIFSFSWKSNTKLRPCPCINYLTDIKNKTKKIYPSSLCQAWYSFRLTGPHSPNSAAASTNADFPDAQKP